MLVEKKVVLPGTRTDELIHIVYMPVGCAYMKTPLSKPLGVYWHLRGPRDYDNHGYATMPK